MKKKPTTSVPPSRRGFLRGAAAVVPAFTLPTWAANAVQETAAGRDSLTALADVVLPAETLGPAGITSVLRRFTRWSENFEPVAELDHPYLSTAEIPYGPPDPRPLWTAQLEALDLEAKKRHDLHYADLAREDRRAILQRQLPREVSGQLLHASLAPHLAIALMSWFYSTTEANDLCHEASIGRHTCRGLPDARLRPANPGTLPDWDEERQ